MTNDTQNALTDFNLCFALSQNAINSQMEAAWKTWKRRKQFQDTIKIFKIKKEGGLADSKYGLEAQIAPLTISLNVESGKLGQVKVTLHLKSGKVVYYDETKEEKAESKIENWSISFITDIDKKAVDIDALAIIDPDVSRTAKEAIEKSGLPDSVFSIEYLFLKFTKVDLLLSDNKNINIPDSVSGAARTKALSCLNLVLQGELGDFMLGTVVRRNNKQATPTFALTDFIFHVHSDWSVSDASTLSYLGMLANQPMPTDKDAARISLKDAWVRPEMIDGTQGLIAGIMAISKEIFMKKYLIPNFSKSLTEEHLELSGLTWTFKRYDQTVKLEQKEPTAFTVLAALPLGIVAPIVGKIGYIDCKYDSGVSYYLDLTIQPGSNQIKISGQIESHAIYDGYYKPPLMDTKNVSWIHYRGVQDISGSVTLTGQGIGVEFKLTCKLEADFAPVKMTTEETGGLADATEFLSKGLKTLSIIGNTPSECMENQQKVLAQSLQKSLKEELANINADLSEHAFIPPGGGVFTFQNPRFSQAGDLIFDVIYQAP